MRRSPRLLVLLALPLMVSAQGREDRALRVRLISSGGPFSTVLHLEGRGVQLEGRGSGPMGPNRKAVQRGKLSGEVFQEVLAEVRSSGLLEAAYSQPEEMGMVCEGGLTLKLRLGKTRNHLRSPCVGEATDETREISGKIEALQRFLLDRVRSVLEVAPDGVYTELIPLRAAGGEGVEPVSGWAEVFGRIRSPGRLTRIGGLESLEELRPYHRREGEKKGRVFLALLHRLQGGVLESFDSLPVDSAPSADPRKK